MSKQLPPPADIRGHYNDLLKEVNGEYIRRRWGEHEIARRHFRQTHLAISYSLEVRGEPGDVLEIGCGPAVWTTLFLPSARSVHLADISEEMLREARARIEKFDDGRHAGKVRYSCGDFLELDLPKESFDTVLSARAFEYMSDKQAFVSKCATLLRPGGMLVLITKNRTWHDSLKATHSHVGKAAAEVPVGTAMQLDLVDWEQAQAMFKRAGLSHYGAFPVALGSYEVNALASKPALAVVDALHRSLYRQKLGVATNWLSRIMESFLVIGKKPS